MTRNTDLVDRIVTSIAEREQRDVADLDPPLYEAVDVDALAAVVEGDGVREVEFSYRGYRVVVRDGGQVNVHEQAADPRSRRPNVRTDDAA